MTYYTDNIDEAYEWLKKEDVLKNGNHAFRIGPDYKSVLVYDMIDKRGTNITEDAFKEIFIGLTFETME